MALLPSCATTPRQTVPADATLKHWQARGSTKGVVMGLHSFGDYRAAFNLIGPALSRAGYQVYSFDQAGFGRRDREGHWAGEKALVSDASHLAEQLACRHGQPVYLLGESLGGAVALLVARHNPQPLAGLVLTAPAVREGIRFRYGWNALIATAAALAPGYRLAVERRADDPSLAPSSARRLATDDRVMRRVRLDTYWGLIQLADSASDVAANLSIKSLLLYGGADHAVPAVGIHRLRHHLAARGDYHFYPDGPHLLLQGRHWQTVAGDILSWLEAQPAQNDLSFSCSA